MKKLLLTLALAVLACVGRANDGVYYVSGTNLVPVQENNISITKEVLTIDIGDDGCAHVDVYYELLNKGNARTVTMGFEASLPYNSGDTFSPQGIHPRIKDFTVTMNGKELTYKNAVIVGSTDDKPSDFSPLNMRKWHPTNDTPMDEIGASLTNGRDTITDIAYGYYFNARFEPGPAVVHHTYTFDMSNGVYRCFEIPYWLTPCTRWANRQVDDFTLRIRAINTAKHFYLNDDVFSRKPFKVIEGTGKVRTGFAYDQHHTEVTLRNGTVECHVTNFKPQENMCIRSADLLAMTKDDFDIGSFYDRACSLYPTSIIDFKACYGREARNEEEERGLYKRICRNLPYANRGYVFSDRNLQRYFNSKWWYMPDPDWQMSSEDFKRTDWLFINELGNENSEVEE